jgi:hypothetical protein
MNSDDEVYSPERQQRLIELVRQLGARISQLSGDADLLAASPELLKLMGDARSELFRYEVRCTYDTPEIAESRRIVEQARQASEFDPSRDADGDAEPWRSA